MNIAPSFTARTVLSNFGPWVVYDLLSVTGPGKAAYAGGLIASLCQVVRRCRSRRVRIRDGVSLLFFLAGTVSTSALHSSLFPRCGSVLIWSTFAAVAWGSLLIDAPFTAEYARDALPPGYWDHPGFRRVNITITAVWGAVFVVNAALAALSASFRGAAAWLQALPYAGTAFGIVFTNRFPQWAGRHRREDSPPGAD